MDLWIPQRELVLLFFELFEIGSIVVMKVFDISVSSTVEVHQINSHVIALLYGCKQVKRRMNRRLGHLKRDE